MEETLGESGLVGGILAGPVGVVGRLLWRGIVLSG